MPLDASPNVQNWDFSNPDLYNPVYIPTFRRREPVLHYYGSAGSGKSVFVAQKEIILSFQHWRRGRKTVVARRYYSTIQNSVYAELLSVIGQWGLRDCFHATRSPFSIVNKITGVEFIFIGLDDVEKIKSVRGIDRGWIEEATELKMMSILDQLRLRLRGFKFVQWTLSYNPTNVNHWLNKEIHEKRPEGHFILKTTYRDNEKLLAVQPHYADTIEAMKITNPNYYRVYGLGMWGVDSEGLIYPNYNTTPELPVPPQCYGLDLGWNDPCVLVAIAVTDEQGKDRRQLYWDERLYESRLGSSDLPKRLNDLNISKKIPIISDTNSPDHINELRKAGYWVIEADKGKGSVELGISIVKKYDLHITAGSKNTFKEIQNYSWKNKNGRWLDEAAGADSEAAEGVDHAMDAGRYGTRYLDKPISSGSVEFSDYD